MEHKMSRDEFAETIMSDKFNVSNPNELRKAISWLVQRQEKDHNFIEIIQINSDMFFLTVNAVFILMMQAGFGFFEAGSIRAKNVINMLFKNVLDAFIGGLAYWALGYGLAFGEPCHPFMGFNHFFGAALHSSLFSHWFFHYSFCVTAATIVSGAVAGRCRFEAYLSYTLMITGFTYPVLTHWAWHSGDDCVGWLGNLGYEDFAGSGVVHLTGGTCALIAALFLGPRHGRFPDKNGTPVVEMPGHNKPFMVLGAFLLFVGFFAFNGGSQASISSRLDGEQTGRAMMNTVLAGSPAAVTGALLSRFTGARKWDITSVLGCGLGGMVAICAGCNQVQPWAAIVIGFIGAIVTFYLGHFVRWLKIDDPVDAVAVHFGAGLWGVISTPLFSMRHGILLFWNQESGYALAYNLAGACAIIGWSALTCVPIFAVLKFAKLLRIPLDDELKGMDIVKHGETAYPDFDAGCQHCKEKWQTTAAGSNGVDKSEELPQYEQYLRSQSQLEDATSPRNGNVIAPNLPKPAVPAWGEFSQNGTGPE